MDGEEPSGLARALLGVALVAAGVVILGAAVTGADVQARGFDFETPLARVLGAVVGIIALAVGFSDVRQAVRGRGSVDGGPS